ncbi:MAG TPA: SDR family oxidoreductase [Polyangiales bacterium]|nr:SDR family oxidoreductase [Polyangiales bacterium]
MPDQALAIVTGANGNLGHAVVSRLVADGFRVAQVERTRILLDGAEVAEVDLSNSASTRKAFELTTRGAKLQAVVHTVGTFRAGAPLVDAADEEFTELFQTNVMTTLHVVQAALAIMQPQKSGRIAVVASLDALQGVAKRAAYGASKAAQLRLVESAAADVKGTPITLNTVLPGTMDTPQNRAAMPKADPSKWLRLEEVANVLAYLVSDAASGIHGQSIRVERS